MKKLILFLLVLLSLQTINAAESYQRWIYWVNEPSYQVTASEMADITAILYEGNILPNREYRLSTGVTYKIPQPNLFLEYIEKAVRLARPSADTPQKVVDAIYGAEKMKWDNNVSVHVKNYYFSTLHNKIQWIDNYSGENKGTDFLFIDGRPVIKCDCGNPLGLYYEGYQPKPEPIVSFSTSKQDNWVYVSPKKVYGNEVPDLYLTSPTKEKKFKWKPVIIVGGVAVGLAGVGYGIYSLITNNRNHRGGPGGAPSTTYHERPVPVITPPVVVPVPGGPGGSPASPNGK